jgi:hypothetical protein
MAVDIICTQATGACGKALNAVPISAIVNQRQLANPPVFPQKMAFLSKTE